MQPFEYVVILISLILSLGIAQILTSIADVFSNFKHTKLSLPHSLLVLFVFFLHIQEWWVGYQYATEVSEWTLPLVLFILIYPILLFLLARMLFPTGVRSHETDLDVYYYGQCPWFFSFSLLIVIVSFLQNIFISHLNPLGEFPHMILIVLYSGFLLSGIRRKWVHNLFYILITIGWITYLVFDRTQL